MNIGGRDISIGIMVRREFAPEQLVSFARRTEQAGYDELWLVEDTFFSSAIASATAALAATEKITVGIGIMPAVARNPVYAAMELATLARMYPNRLLPGFGHGMAFWMKQIGAFPKSQLSALEETTITVKQLLNGEAVNFDGKEIHISDNARLVFPPSHVPPISLGVRGPKSLQMSGRVADGTILSEFAAPEYARWARQQVALGQGSTEADVSPYHRLTVFAMAYFDDDEVRAFEQAKARVIGAIHNDFIDHQLEPIGLFEQASDMRSRNALPAEMPDAWVHDLTILGNRQSIAETIGRFIDAGADSIVLVPPTDQALAMPNEIGARLMSFLK
ncbi:MAG TPA: LLM class flavin-dependent oxidoreductase [Phototrophicaceae bacterium]|nr:LLM class flavin-dependent oxidoreductase [Phototrophicaceae bacterium]